MSDTPLYETRTWMIREEFYLDPYSIRFKIAAPPHSAQLDELEIRLWNRDVRAKYDTLIEEGEKKLMFVEGKEDGRHALYAKLKEGDPWQQAMVAGTQYSLDHTQFGSGENLIFLSPMLFSQTHVMRYPEYRELFESLMLAQGAGKPKMGACAPVAYIRPYGKVLLIERGSATPKYPWGLCGVGGDIHTLDYSLGEFLEKTEVDEEIRTGVGHPTHCVTLGLIVDNVLNKTDIPIRIDWPASYAEFGLSRRYQADVAGLRAISDDDSDLADFVVDNYVPSLDPRDPRWAGHLISPACAGLFMLGKHLYGDCWAVDVHSRLMEIDERESKRIMLG